LAAHTFLTVYGRAETTVMVGIDVVRRLPSATRT
jgi:hypothetical protein